LLAKLETNLPNIVGSSSPLWTDVAVRDLLRAEFSTDLSLGSVRRLLASMGLLPKKSLAEIFESRLEWFANEYPRILKLSRRQGAEILFEVASQISWKDLNEPTGTKGEESTSKGPVRSAHQRRRYLFLSAINTRGATKFLVVGEGITDKKYLSFLSRLLDSSSKPLFVVAPDRRANPGGTIRSYLERNAARLKVFGMLEPR
jgi:hypothetical protein